MQSTVPEDEYLPNHCFFLQPVPHDTKIHAPQTNYIVQNDTKQHNRRLNTSPSGSDVTFNCTLIAHTGWLCGMTWIYHPTTVNAKRRLFAMTVIYDYRLHATFYQWSDMTLKFHTMHFVTLVCDDCKLCISIYANLANLHDDSSQWP